MKSLTLIYPNAQEVELKKERIAELEPTQCLCEAVKSLVSIGTEINCLRGNFETGTNWEQWVQYPFTPGYSMVARVLEVGKEVKNFKVGDRVAALMPHSQYFVVDSKQLVKLDGTITDEQATWVPLARVAQNGVRRIGVKLGDNVVVIGLGQVGQLAIEFAKIAGANNIIAIDPIDKRCEIAKNGGAATHVIRGGVMDALEQIQSITNQVLADVVIDATGNPSVLAQACQLTRSNGKLGLIGDTPLPSTQFLGPGVVSKSLSIIGSHGGNVASMATPFYPWTMEKTNGLTLDLIKQKRLKVDHLVTNRCSPHDAPKLYKELLTDRSNVVGILIDWTMCH